MLRDLDSNESVLLMYLAGELPEADRIEVEQMLRNDGALRSELEALRDAQAKIEAGLSALDERQGLAGTAEGMSRVVMAEWRRRQAAESRRVAPQAVEGRGWRWWHTAAAAAAVLIGLIAWWGLSGGWVPEPTPERQIAGGGSGETQGDAEKLAMLEGSLWDVSQPNDSMLAVAEMHLAELTRDFDRWSDGAP